MDTGTHFVMGLGLFGLAQLDPVVGQHPATSQAVLLGTVIGSQIPDIDTIYRLKGNSSYIRHHRGWTHSLPMVLLWPLILTLVLMSIFPQTHAGHLFFWNWIAVAIHIGIDVLNAYGTQALKPISNQWISFNIINIFDPFIFSLHIIAFFLWFFLRIPAGWLFAAVYLVMLFYILWRYHIHRQSLQYVKQQINQPGRYTLIPTVKWNVWNVIIEQEERVLVGELKNKQLEWTGIIDPSEKNHPAAIKSKEAEAVAAFLSFTSYGYPEVTEKESGYEVKWRDVRYHHKKHFPFVAVAILDHDFTIQQSFVGWISEKRVQSKAQHSTN